MSHLDKTLFFTPKFFVHLMHPMGNPLDRPPHNVAANAMICVHLSWENKLRTLWLCSILANRIQGKGSENYFTPLLDVVEALIMIDDPMTEFRMKAILNPHHNFGLLNAGCVSTVKIAQTISFILRLLPKRPLLAGWVFEDAAVKNSVKKACESGDAKHLLTHFEDFWSEKAVFPRKSLSDATFDFDYPVLALTIFT